LEGKKDEGVALVKNAHYEEAIKKFENSLNAFTLEEFTHQIIDLKERAHKLKCSLWGNIAFSYMQ